MSLSEILVVVIVAILICNPNDIKVIIQEFYKLKKYFLEIKYKFTREFTEPFEQELENLKLHAEDLKNQDLLSEMNFYLSKIAALDQSYDGQYSLSEIKKYYYQLITKQQNE
jgi:hypothetical protein